MECNKNSISTLASIVDAVFFFDGDLVVQLRLCATHSAHHTKGNIYYQLNSMSALPVCFKAKKSWTNYGSPSIPWLMPLSCLVHGCDLLSRFWHFRIYSEWFCYHISWNHVLVFNSCCGALWDILKFRICTAASVDFHLWSTCHCLVVGRVLLLMGKRGPNLIECDWHGTLSHLLVIYSF